MSQVHTDKLQATTRQEQPRRSVLSLLSALVECVACVVVGKEEKKVRKNEGVTLHHNALIVHT